MKRIIRWSILLILLAVAAAAIFVMGPAGSGSGRRFLHVPTAHADKSTVMDSIQANSLLRHPRLFSMLSDALGVWDKLKPGRYEVSGNSLLGFIRDLRNGRQAQVKMVITKLRTKEDLARVTAKLFESDSAAMMDLLNDDKRLSPLGLDTNTAMTAVIPDTYFFNWNSTPSTIFQRLAAQRANFWTAERKGQAKELGLTTEQVYILASIIEEESNKNDEKPRIASVYLNRLRKPMRLSADPTVKFALKDFTLKRIREKHIAAAAASPYNTYLHDGLPPGPICTPSEKTIDAVLHAERTDYLYFCARPDFSGYHSFASTGEEHLRNAKAYQKALDSLLVK